MKGKILDTSTILGDDGKSYTFSQDNVINIKDRSIESFIGSDVDFVESGADAQSIYIYTNKSFLNHFKDIIFSSDIRSIKYKIFCAIVFEVISLILYFVSDFIFTRIYLHYIGINQIIGKSIALAFFIVGIVLVFMALRALSYESGSKTLTRNYIIAIILTILSIFMEIAYKDIASMDIEVDMYNMYFYIFNIAELVIEVSIIAIVALIARELAFIMKQKYILYAFYLNICASVCVLISLEITLVLCICVLILYIIAFVQFSEIRKRTDSDAMPWFPK